MTGVQTCALPIWNFFQNGDQWIDAEVQRLANPAVVRVAFGTPEYFEWVARHPEALPWLALGPKVKFVLGGTVYEVSE